jgi:hypothetical protein
MNDNNAKNQLLELLQELGCHKSCAEFDSKSDSQNGNYYSTLLIIFPNALKVKGTGVGRRVPESHIAAAQVVLDLLHANYPHFFVDWRQISLEAQAGDALIKLGVYLSSGLSNTNGKSELLQNLESDSHLAKIFDIWKSNGDPDLLIWGTELGEKRKATLVEALIWRRFASLVLNSDAPSQFKLLLELLNC